MFAGDLRQAKNPLPELGEEIWIPICPLFSSIPVENEEAGWKRGHVEGAHNAEVGIFRPATLEGKAELKAQGHSRGNWPIYRNLLQKMEKNKGEVFLAGSCEVRSVTTGSGEGRSQHTQIPWEDDRQATAWEAEVGHQEKPPLQEAGTTSNGYKEGWGVAIFGGLQDFNGFKLNHPSLALMALN